MGTATLRRTFSQHTNQTVGNTNVASTLWDDGIAEVSTITLAGWEATHTITFAAAGRPPVTARKSAGSWSVFGTDGNLLFAGRSFTVARELAHGEALWVAAEVN